MNYAEDVSSFQKIMLICLPVFLGFPVKIDLKFQIFKAVVKISSAVREINLLELWKYSRERVHDGTNLQVITGLITSFDDKVFIACFYMERPITIISVEKQNTT